MCYPNSVLFHVRLRGLDDDQVRALSQAPGISCRLEDDDVGLVRMEFANPVPSWPNVRGMESDLTAALRELAPTAEIVDVRYGYRYDADIGSPAVEALRRLRIDLARIPTRDELDADELTELLTVIAREFTILDIWMCNGGSTPMEWVRRHPDGDLQANTELAILDNPYAAMSA